MEDTLKVLAEMKGIILEAEMIKGIIKVYKKLCNHPLAIFDSDLRFLHWNDKWEEQFPGEIEKGKHHWDVYPDIPDEWKSAHLQTLTTKKGLSRKEDSFRGKKFDWELIPITIHGQFFGMAMKTSKFYV